MIKDSTRLLLSPDWHIHTCIDRVIPPKHLPSQATHAAVDNSAPHSTRPDSTYKSEKLFRQAEPLLILCHLGENDPTKLTEVIDSEQSHF